MLKSLIRRVLDLDAIEAYMEESLAYIENFPYDDEEN